MKKVLFFGVGLCSALAMTSCKSSESAYKKAYEKAKAQEMAAANQQTEEPTATVTPVTTTETVTVTPVTTPVQEDHSDVRTISGGVSVVSGTGLQAYSVVVGSFSTQANAEGLQATLKSQGYNAQIVKTNETINGITGWFRVIASTFADKASAVQSRDALRSTYSDAWLLYNK